MKKLLLAAGISCLVSFASFAQTGATLRFDGQNDFVIIPPSLSSTNDFAIQFWVKCDTNLVNQRVFSFWNNPSQYMRFSINEGTGRPRFTINAGTGEQIVEGISPLFWSGWNQVTIAQQGNTCRYFLNGIQEGINPTMSVHLSDVGPIANYWIGRSDVLSEPFFKGTIDEFRIWNKTVCPDEVNAYLNCEINTQEPGLSANYHFNQGIDGGNNSSINVLTDASGNNFHGNLLGFLLQGILSNWISPGGVITGASCNIAPNVTFYEDADADGFGNLQVSMFGSSLCPPPGFVLDSTDCNDNNSFIGNTVYVYAGADQTLCTGGSALLIADGNVDNYAWNNGETGVFIFVSPPVTTTYVLNGTTSGGCSATDSVTITVNQQPAITFLAQTDSASCTSINDGGITISNVVGGSSQNGYQYIIYGNDFYEQNTTGVFNNLFADQYTVNIIDDSGCEGANPMSVIVESPAPLVLHVTPPVLGLCQGATGSVTLNVTGGAGMGYSISGDTTAGLTVGSYFYTVSEPGGCTSTTELQVVELVPPSPVISAAGSLQICDGEGVLLSVQPDSNFALKFDGLDDYLLGDNSDLPYGNSSRTVEAWINPSNVSDGTIFSYGDTIGNFTLGLRNGKLYGHAISDADGFIETHESFGTTTLVPGTWYHVAFEYYNFQYRLYLNSALESESFAYNYVMGNNYKIGADINGAHFYNGLMDELRVWNYELGPSELFLNSQSFTNNGSYGLIEYFNFNEGTDTIAYNSSTFTSGQGAPAANPVGGIIINNQEAAILKNGTMWSVFAAPVDSVVSYLWTPNNVTNDSITANAAGTYTVLATYSSGCSASASIEVTSVSCINPYYPPPVNGKVDDKIGSELSQLYFNQSSVTDTATIKNNIYLISSDSVYIEVIANDGQYSALLTLLLTPAYGMTDTIDNGINPFIITGKYPINHLKKLDSIPTLVNYVRPYYPPVSSSGIAYSKGDVSMRSDASRSVFGVNGQGVKVGVISNSFNTLSGNKAAVDVSNGDLPSGGVSILLDYPYGKQSDEGRAMAQIVHDIAPNAEIAFRTGFISAGDFAEGIKELASAGCDVIVDDVTYITEPFFKEGLVSTAVNTVAAQGVSYFSAAGNFGNKAYEGVFNPVVAPAGFTGSAHDFGGGDLYQSITLPAGSYTIVLQWEDSIYSLGQLPGTRNDLDIYLVNDAGAKIFGFNRKNNWGDPIEVLPFTVGGTAHANIMITRAWGTDNVRFKYIVFRGEAIIDEHNSTSPSSIVGQANSAGAMAVGAVLYTNTPSFGVNPPTVASFSSIGGTAVNGIVRNKPEFCAPNGVNTTVNMGGVNIDGDAFPNFFGTSCSAPHAAAVAALLIEAKQKYYSQSASPSDIRNILQNTALDMGAPGFDYNTGSGFIQADSALQSFVAPKPLVDSLHVPAGITAGTTSFTVSVFGSYLSPSSVVFLNGSALNSTYVNAHQIDATVPAFIGNPPVWVSTASICTNLNDGGTSDTVYFFQNYKQKIKVVADNKNKKFGEKLPVFTSTITVDGVDLASTTLTLADLGLNTLTYSTPANSKSNVALYYIRPERTFNMSDPTDVALNQLYTYDFVDGLLEIEKMPLLITPKDTSLVYGEKIGGFKFNYVYDNSNIDQIDQVGFLDSIETEHNLYLAEDGIALVDGKGLVNGRGLVNADIAGLTFMVSGKGLVNARGLVNGKGLVNNVMTYDTTHIVDIALASIFNYQVNQDTTVLVSARRNCKWARPS
jgi:hypothetical protein